jgi:hypothetical protein
MQQSSRFKFILDGRCMIWQRSRHCSDALDKPSFLQAQIDCKLFPIPKADISEPVFAANFHGQLYFLYVNLLVRQNACQIVEGRESDSTTAPQQQSIVLCMSIRPGD